MKKQAASPRRMRAAAEHLCPDHRRLLLSGAGFAALAAGMALAAASPVRAQSQVTGPAGGPVSWTSGDLTVTSAGTIGSSAVGVAASGTLGTFSNAGAIDVTQTAVDIASSSVVSSLANSGSLQSGGSGLNIGSGAQVSAFSNLSGGTIHAVQAGVANSGGLGWLSNAGAIQSDTTFGVANGGELGTFQNQTAGTIRSNGSGNAAAVYNTGDINTFSNSGQLLAPNANAVLIASGGVGHLSNETGGVINSSGAAIWNNGSITTLSNGGSITSSGDAAIRNFVSIGTLANWGGIGGASGVVNSGTIGTLDNSGTIQAGNVGVDNQGSIQTLTNEAGGQITANIGVRIDGSVGVLNNSGYITSATSAVLIDSTGSLGRINNPGVIQGYIENDTAHDLTIAGGSGSAYGTLTGYAGGQAAILNGSSDLYLSGNLILDDTLFLGQHTLYSTGNLELTRAVSVNGNVSQAGGSLMFAVASPTSYAQLNVQGQAQVSIANAAVGLLPASNGILAAGQSYTVVQAPAGAITVSNDTTRVAGFNGILTNTGHALVLSLLASVPSGGGASPGGASSGGASSGGASSGGASSGGASGGSSSGGSNGGGGGSNSGATSSGGSSSGSNGFTPSTPTGGGGSSGAGGAVNNLSNGGTPAAQAFNAVIVPPLVGLSPGAQALALSELGPSSLGLQIDLQASGPVNDAVASQQASYRAQAQGRSYASLSDELYGGGLEKPAGGLWGKIVGGGASGDANGGAPFSASMVGAVFGGDVVRGEQLYGGLAASWVGTWASGKGAQQGASLHLNSYQITAYGSAAPRAFNGRLSIDALIGVGFNRYDQERPLQFLNSAARASFDGEQYTGRLTVGYAFIGRTLTITPYAGVDEIHVAQHGYTETGAGLADLHVGGVTTDTFRHDIGAKVEAVYDVGGGVQMLPSVKLGWGHTYDNGPVAVYSTLAGVSFSSLAARPAADGALVGATLAFRDRGRLSVDFEYQGDLRRDFQSHTGAVRVRVRF